MNQSRNTHDVVESPVIPQPRRGTTGIRVRRGVIAVLSHGAHVLLIRRADNLVKGGAWCFPGGHIERGENSHRAIQRELAEELGIRTTPTLRLGAVRVDGRYVLAVWRVRYGGEELFPSVSEIAEVRWVLPHEIRAIRPSLPSNDVVLRMLQV